LPGGKGFFVFCRSWMNPEDSTVSRIVSEIRLVAAPAVVAAMCLMGGCLPALGAASPAAFREVLLRDFAPSAAVVTRVQSHALVLDRGQEEGIATGDLFTVYGKGPPVLRPGSGEVVGHLKQPLAVLQVRQAARHTALCEVVSGNGPFSPGQSASRFKDLKAAILVPGDPVATRRARDIMVNILPGLDWVETSDVFADVPTAEAMETMGVVLLFSTGSGRLLVSGPGGRTLRNYVLSGAAGQGEKEAPAPVGEAVSTHWVRPVELDESKLVGRLPESLLQLDVADLDEDGEAEVISLLPTSLFVSPFRRPGPVVAYRLSGPGRFTNFSIGRPEGWIAANVLLDGVGLRSSLFRYKAQSLAVSREDVNLWLAFVDRSGDGVAESLIGQAFDPQTMFGADVYLLSLSADGGIEYGDRLEAPPNFDVLGVSWADLNGNAMPELITRDRAGGLRIYENGQLVWVSPAPVAPRAEGGDLLVGKVVPAAKSKGPSHFLFAEGRAGLRAEAGERLVMLEWVDGAYAIRPVTHLLGARICGLCRIDGRLYCGVARSVSKKDGGGETLLYSVGTVDGFP